MTIYATCGHEISVEWMMDMASNVVRKCWDRECERALSFECVCPECRSCLAHDGQLLLTEAEQQYWLAA